MELLKPNRGLELSDLRLQTTTIAIVKVRIKNLWCAAAEVRNEHEVEVPENSAFNDGSGPAQQETIIAFDPAVFKKCSRIQLQDASQIDREVAHRVGRLVDQDLAAPARAIDQPQAQAARVDSLGEHETLALLEVEHEGDLPRSVGLHACRGHDAGSAGDRRGVAGYHRKRAQTAVRQRLQLHVHLRALARRHVRQIAHRAVELDRQVDLVVVIGYFNDVHQPLRRLHGRLGECAARKQRTHPSQREGATLPPNV